MMAYVANDIPDDEQKQAQGAVAPAGNGAVHLAPSAGVGSTGAGGGTTAAPKEAGGQFASLDKYLTANQGQAEPLAGKITGSIGQEYNSLNQGNQGTIQNIAGQVSNAPGYTKGNADILTQEAANPVSFAGDTGNVSAFQKQLTNNYGGPQSAEGTNEYQAQQAKLNNAISQGQAQTTTAAGRQQLVAQNSAAPTTGVTALNSAILSKSPEALQSVQDAYKPFQNLVGGLSTGAQDVNKTIAQEQADAAASSKAAQGQIAGQMTGLNTAVQNQLTQQQAAAAAQNAALKQNLTSGNLSDQNLQALGITRDQWNTFSAAQKAAATSDVVNSANGQFGANTGTATIDPSAWLTQQDPNAVLNANNTATPEQYQQAQAFQSLVNGLNLQTPQMTINPATASQAGTAPTNLNAFDYQGALQNAQTTEAASNAAAQAYVNALQSGADEQHAQLAAANAQKSQTMQNIAGLAQTPVGATNAVAHGAVTAGQNVGQQFSTPTNAAKNIGLNVLTGGLSTPVQSVAKGVQNAVSTVTNIFCFHPWTLIDMLDGSLKPIWQIKIGDITRGGKVLATTRGVGTDFYWYNGVLVTGKHAVKENGKWVRVENSNGARHFKYLTEVVCNLVTENHRIWSNGNEFADEHETDDYENLNLDESLAEMNKYESFR